MEGQHGIRSGYGSRYSTVQPFLHGHFRADRSRHIGFRILVNRGENTIRTIPGGRSNGESDCIAVASRQKLYEPNGCRLCSRRACYAKSIGSFILQKQLEIYERENGFISDVWKTFLSDSVTEMLKNYKPERERVWLLEVDGVLSGCIAIVQAAEETAQLRFFFVDSGLRGFGAGELLISSALLYCREKQYRSVFLWTCADLKAARHLYAKHGFVITESHENQDWGVPAIEERWELKL